MRTQHRSTVYYTISGSIKSVRYLIERTYRRLVCVLRGAAICIVTRTILPSCRFTQLTSLHNIYLDLVFRTSHGILKSILNRFTVLRLKRRDFTTFCFFRNRNNVRYLISPMSITIGWTTLITFETHKLLNGKYFPSRKKKNSQTFVKSIVSTVRLGF